MKNQKIIIAVVIAILIALASITFVRFLSVPKLNKMLKQETTHEVDSDNTNTNAHENNVINIEHLEQIDQLKHASGPMILKFYSDWCGACIAAKPVYAQLADKFKGQVTFYAVNVKNNEIVTALQNDQLVPEEITAIPTFVLRNHGSTVTSTRGFGSKQALEEIINKGLVL